MRLGQGRRALGRAEAMAGSLGVAVNLLPDLCFQSLYFSVCVYPGVWLMP